MHLGLRYISLLQPKVSQRQVDLCAVWRITVGQFQLFLGGRPLVKIEGLQSRGVKLERPKGWVALRPRNQQCGSHQCSEVSSHDPGADKTATFPKNPCSRSGEQDQSRRGGEAITFRRKNR